MIRYLDTSAALKLLVSEVGTDAVVQELNASMQRGDQLVASMLLHTELHCAARRRGSIDPDAVRVLLDAVDLVDLRREDLLWASSAGWGLRSADAIHLAVALRLDVDDVLTYDTELAHAAAGAGLQVSSPK